MKMGDSERDEEIALHQLEILRFYAVLNPYLKQMV
jgi:hypothetical protein